MQGNWLSFKVDLGYTELFHIPAVTSVSFSSCEGFHGDALEFCQANQGCYLFNLVQGIALHAMHGNRASCISKGEVSWFFSSCGGNLGYILELRQG